MKIVECLQGSEEWRAARAGNITASRMSDVLAKLKNPKNGKVDTQARANYKAQLIAEILTGEPQDDLLNTYAIRRGHELEPFARRAYANQTGISVDQVGFVLHERIDRYGCSPDGLVGSDGMVQFKCPFPATHIKYLLDKVVPEDYEPQCVAELDVCERDWNDFVSFCPEMPENLQLFIVRLHRDEPRVLSIRQAVKEFNEEVSVVISDLLVAYPVAALTAK